MPLMRIAERAFLVKKNAIIEMEVIN
jgi:hypothetical protein